MIIKKTDFNSWVQFTQNIEDRILNPHIQNVQIEKINPELGDELYNAVLAIAETNPVAWSNATAYTVGMYATEQVNDVPSYSDKVYRSIQAGTNEPLTNAAYWVLDPLGTFWLNYVRPWAVFESFHRFCVWQGVNVVQYSIVYMDTTVSTVIDSKKLSFILDNIQTSSNVRRAKMKNYLDDNNWTIAGVVYEIDCDDYKPTKASRIRAVGRKGKYLNN